MNTIPRSAGIGLLVYAVGATAGFVGAGGPGGSYEPTVVAGYVDPSHYTASLSFWYLGALSSLGLLVFGYGLRRLGGAVGETAWALSTAAVAASVVGAFVGGGLVVALAEGGGPVQQGLPHPVVYTVSEIGNLVSLCAPAFLVGVLAIVLAARARLPRWLRVLSALAGLSGILLAFYFTIPVYLLWAVIFGGWLVAKGARTRAATTEPERSLV
ncbi:hypothetical protein FHX52_2286 [Humibacillus xanthopallidus]|uniref:DUF4386 family protein n=1 Tax=Humibacillus xanthopallidus TaxID=412689 RepID=A0A543PNC4_9MICO|nr:hypothetical protein [Humibacillus xanthopallidus]TQN45588.1 hypothetical protein FHX52_2286 [Humibacillus xanthopallidus]